jgi:hypothetical protein
MPSAESPEDKNLDSSKVNPVASFAPSKVAHYIGKKV